MEGNTLVEQLIGRFKNFEPIKLTKEEEIAILESITEKDMIDHGSSRIVYDFRDWVVKVALSTGGMNQNAIEVDVYETHGQSGCFAHIYAYGKMITIMERLTDCEYYDPFDFYYDEEDEDDKAFYETISLLIADVNDFTGYEGGDNGQIGFSDKDNCYKVYDYGYSLDYNREEIVDDLDRWIHVVDPLDYIKGVVRNDDIIISQEDFKEMWRNYREGEEDQYVKH